MWEILLHSKVDKFLNSLDKNLAERIRNKLRELRDDPFRFLEHFEDRTYYKLRIGEYRALIDIDFEKKQLKVHVLDYRSRVYKK